MLTGPHVTGGSLGGLIAYCSARFGWGVTSDEALTIGAAFVGVGGGLAHLFTPPGLLPRVREALGLASAKPAK